MGNNLIYEIRFAMQKDLLDRLLQNGNITQPEYNKALHRLREKNNCKLIVTSAKI